MMSLKMTAMEILDMMIKEKLFPEGTVVLYPKPVIPPREGADQSWEIQVRKPDGSEDSFVFDAVLTKKRKLH